MKKEIFRVCVIALLVLTISLSTNYPFKDGCGLIKDLYFNVTDPSDYNTQVNPLLSYGYYTNLSVANWVSSNFSDIENFINYQYTNDSLNSQGIRRPIIYVDREGKYWIGRLYTFTGNILIFNEKPNNFGSLTEKSTIIDTSAETLKIPKKYDHWIKYTLAIPPKYYAANIPSMKFVFGDPNKICFSMSDGDWDVNSINNSIVEYPAILSTSQWIWAEYSGHDCYDYVYVRWGYESGGGLNSSLSFEYDLGGKRETYTLSTRDYSYFFYFSQPEGMERLIARDDLPFDKPCGDQSYVCENSRNWLGEVRANDNFYTFKVAFMSDGRPVLVGKVYSSKNNDLRIFLPYCPKYIALKYLTEAARLEGWFGCGSTSWCLKCRNCGCFLGCDPYDCNVLKACCGLGGCIFDTACWNCGACGSVEWAYDISAYFTIMVPYVADVCEISEYINTTIKTAKFGYTQNYYSAFTHVNDTITAGDYRYPRLYIEFEPTNGFLRKLEYRSNIYVGFTSTNASEVFLKAPMKVAYIPSKDSSEQITQFFSYDTPDFSYENLDYMYKTVLDAYSPSKYFVFGYHNQSSKIAPNYGNVNDLAMAYWAYFSGYGFEKINDLNAEITYEMRLKKLLIGNEFGENLTLELNKYIIDGKNLFKHDNDYNYLSLDGEDWYKYDRKPRTDIKIPVKFFSEVKSSSGQIPLLDVGDKLYLETIIETNKPLQNKSYVVFSFVGDIDSESIGFVEILYEDGKISISTSLESIPPVVNSCASLEPSLYCYAEMRSSTTNITLLSCEIKEVETNKYRFACLVDTELLAILEPTKDYQAPILDNRFLKIVSFSSSASSIFPNVLSKGIFIDFGPADLGTSEVIRIFDLPFIKDGAAEYLLSYLSNYVAYTKSISDPSIFVEVYVGVWPGSGEKSNYPGNLEKLFNTMITNFRIGDNAYFWGSNGKKLREFLFTISHQSFIPLKDISIEIKPVRLINRIYKLPEAEFNLTIPTGMGYEVTNTTGLLKLKIKDLELCKVRYNETLAYGYECVSLDQWENPKVYCGITETRVDSNDYKIWVLDNYLDGKKAIVIYMPWKVSISDRNVTIKFDRPLKYHFIDASRDTIFRLFNGISGIPYNKGFYLHDYLDISGKKEYFYLVEDNKNGTIIIGNITYLDTYIYLEYDESANIEEVIIKHYDNSTNELYTFVWINDDIDTNDNINVSYNLTPATIQLSNDNKYLTYTVEYTVDLSKPYHAFCIIYDKNDLAKKFYRTILDMRYNGYYYGFFYHINYTYIVMAYSKTTPSFTPQTLGLLATVMDLVPWLYAKFMPDWSLKDISSISTTGLPSRPVPQNINVSRWVLATSCPNGICEPELGENCGNCIDCINQTKENQGWTCAYLNPNLNYRDYIELKLCNESVFDETGYIKIAAKGEECNCTAQCLRDNICLYGYCCPEEYPLAIDLDGDGVINDTEKCIAISADVALVTFTGSGDLVININTAKAYNESGIIDNNVKNDLSERDIIKYAFESNNLTIRNCANFCDSDYLNESDEIQSIIMLYCCKPEIKNETVSNVLSGILGRLCSSDSDCNDNNPCTLDYCWNDRCVHFNLPNSFPINATHRCFNGTVAAECVGKLWFDPELGEYRPKAGKCGAECEMNGTNDTICLGKGFDMINDSYAIVWTGYCTQDFICERITYNCYPGCFNPINQSCVENGTIEDIDFDGVNETCINGDWNGTECRGKICGQCVEDSDCTPANITLSDRYILSYLPVCVAGYCKTVEIDCATYKDTPGGCADPINKICVPNGTEKDIDNDGVNETCVIGNWIGAEIYYNYTENKTYVNDFAGECVITEPETNASRYCFYGGIYINDSYYLVGTGVCKENTTCEFIENNVYPGCFYDGKVYDNETLLDVDDDNRPEICINGDWIGAECKGKACYDDGLECYEDIVAKKVCTGYELINESAYYNYTGRWASPGTCECEKVLVDVYPDCIKPYMYEKFKIEIVSNGTSMNVDADYEEETCINGRWINAECRIIGNILDCGLGTTYSILVNVTES